MWRSDPHLSAAMHVCVFTTPSCSTAPCVQSGDANVCDVQFKSLYPRWMLETERGVSHVQWIIASHAEGEGRRMQKATTAYKKKHHHNTSPPARTQSAAHMLRWMKGFLTHAEWHISMLGFFSHTRISQGERFPFRVLLCPSLLVSTNLHLRLPKLEMLEGEDAKWEGDHTKTHCNTSSFHCRAFPSQTSTFPFTLSLSFFLDFTCMAVNAGQFSLFQLDRCCTWLSLLDRQPPVSLLWNKNDSIHAFKLNLVR